MPKTPISHCAGIGASQGSTAPWLLARATFGYRPDEAAEVETRGHSDWIQWQLQASAIPDPSVDKLAASSPVLQVSRCEALGDPTFDRTELTESFQSFRLARAVITRRQLAERVHQFWSEHFHVDMESFMRIHDDATVWRGHSMGRFRDLLHAITRSASMIAALGNDQNVASAPNDALARTILALHTLGDDGPHTESDVSEFARCLTGWNYVGDSNDTAFGDFQFRAADHDDGPKTILGLSITGRGTAEVDSLFDHIAAHPATAKFVTAKLARWFHGASAPQSVIDQGIETWLSTGGDIAQIVTVLLSPASIRTIQCSGEHKLRRPLEWFTAVLRCTATPVAPNADAHNSLKTLRRAPFEWPSTGGAPMSPARWAQLLQPRWDVAARFSRPESLGSGFWSHTPADLLALITLPAGELVPRTAWSNHLNQVLTGGRLTPTDTSEIQEHLDTFPSSTPTADVLGEALEVVLTCPSYQLI